MGDMPERIWADNYSGKTGEGYWRNEPLAFLNGGTQYVRADLAALPPAPDAVEAQTYSPATIYLTEVDYEDPDYPLVWASVSADSGGVPYHRDDAVEAMVKAVDDYRAAINAFDGYGDMDHKINRLEKAVTALDAALAAIRAGGKP